MGRKEAIDFMVEYYRAKLAEDEDLLKRLKTVRFANHETVAALEKWVNEGKRILGEIEKL